MKIALINITEEGLPLQFTGDADWWRGCLPGTDRKDCSLQKVDATFLMKRVRETIYLEGHLDALVEIDCCRCLETNRIPVQSDFRYTFSPGDEEMKDEVELSPEDMDLVYYREEMIDLDPIVYEQVLLQIPIKTLCDESCQGLCPRCGINLNRESCQCREQVVDERFAILKKLKA